MPIYEYRCASCGFQKEFLQKMSDAPIKVCPECGKPKFNKLVSAAGFQLKGKGWYATDFKGGSKPALDTKKEGSPAKTDKKEESKSAAACGAGACPACSE